jgi:hypothetical protein
MYTGGIVTNGLVLNLDAGKQDSYPRSGTTWRDISGNGRNATLVNGPTFSNENAGSIALDGTNDYGTCNIPAGSADFTYSIWMRRVSTATGLLFVFGKYTDTVSRGCMLFIQNNILAFRIGAAGSGFAQVTFSSPITGSNWTNISVSVNRTSNALLYRNGVFDVQGDISSQQGNVPNLDYIGSLTGGNWFLNANLGTIQVYNRALSATEISQNFNALRGRYGI